jgi:hypothetical protein
MRAAAITPSRPTTPHAIPRSSPTTSIASWKTGS